MVSNQTLSSERRMVKDSIFKLRLFYNRTTTYRVIISNSVTLKQVFLIMIQSKNASYSA